MQIDNNLLVLVAAFGSYNGERFVSACLYDQDKRTIKVCEFQDNEHLSTFECLILQANPSSNDTTFKIALLMPELEVEARKVRDILEQCELKWDEKSKKEFGELNEASLNKVLDRNLNHYLQESQIARSCMQHLLDSEEDLRKTSNKITLELLKLDKFMRLDLAAINALMIFPKPGVKQFENVANTLLEYLDKCHTLMGKKCLRRWLKMPLQQISEIQERLKIVEFLVENSQYRQILQDDFLKRIPDLDKLYAKFYKVKSNKKHNASLSDVVKVHQLIQKLRDFTRKTSDYMSQKGNILLSEYFRDPLLDTINGFETLEEMIEKCIDLTKAYSGEYIVNPRFSEALKKLSERIKQTLEDIESIRKQTEEELGINVALIESGTHTYIFEAKKQSADEAFRKNQRKYKTVSVKNRALTFTIEELQAVVAEYNHLRDEYSKEQAKKVAEILDIVASYYPVMEQASKQISEMDVLAAFANVAHHAPRQFVRPTFAQKREIVLIDSRHPLLESIDNNCIMNDLEMNQQNSRLHIITGPNMGGKSTYIRQIAICVLLAHIGCFVPCKQATLPIIDAIITRVGASDVQTRGISTFMSEMLEASCMLKTSTENSLIIIDELGRGTSTSEGFGIAWAIAEHIAREIKAFCLFATHFHEMTLMEREIAGVRNYYVSCVLLDNKITMQYKVRPGAVDRSYGLLVAEMLKFPKEVIDDAKLKASELETFEHNLEAQMMEEELPMFKDFNDEFLYRVKNSTIVAKERVVNAAEKWDEELAKIKDEKKRKDLVQKRKQLILKLLK